MTTTALAPREVRRGSIITGNLLAEWGVCSHEADRVDELWPGGAPLTLENLVRAQDEGLDLHCFMNAILPPPAREEYERVRATALEEYERVRATALEEYERVMAPALEEYERVTASAWEEYERVKATALEEYERVTATALEEYERVMAPAWEEYERVRVEALWVLIPEAVR